MLPVAGEQSICERSCHFPGAACVSSLENLGRAGRWSLRNCSHHGKNDFEVDCTLRCLTYSLHHGHQHTNSTLQADEEVWTEIDRYKGCLKAMFARDDECVIFTEMAAKVCTR